MRSKNKLKGIASALLICFALTVIPAQSLRAETGIFFQYSTATKLLTDLRYNKQAAAAYQQKYSLCDKDRALLVSNEAALTAKVDGLEKDKGIYKKEAEKFQALYTDADKARIKAETQAPSRLTWFTAGAGAVLLSIVAIFFAAK
ncbi:hypothetical protein [Oryzomonas rubra]|uniref:Uncharacterized protein n=1 Tax=Oryzomonas rubra TaxID=2509454 RepID=A0A5A9X9A9_9BACT|nr:hypothetical protein [Oryzomonas rubra]KAA0888789.1 hypothetical protein ET418_15525 [Oryzomonas rubra]